MRLAETVGTRWVLVLGTLASAGALALTLPGSTPTQPRTPVRPYHGCTTGKLARPAPPPKAPAGDFYFETLKSVGDELTSCVVNHAGVTVRLSIDVAPSGRVQNIEVRTFAENLANVDLHVVSCLQTVVSPLVFPASDVELRKVSVYLDPSAIGTDRDR